MNKQQQKSTLVDKQAASSHYTRKIAITVGGAALGLSGLADAGIVYQVGGGSSFTAVGYNGSFVDWDIDGVDGANFTLSGSNYGFATTTTYGARVNVGYNSVDIVGVGPVANRLFGTVGSNNIAGFSSGAVVGPTAGPLLGSALLASNFSVSTTGGAVVASGAYSPLGSGNHKIGFQFLSGSDLLFGWANFGVNLSSPGSVTIIDWAYCDTAGCTIEVGDVGVPEPALPSLLLLGMGAAGVARWKKKNRELSS